MGDLEAIVENHRPLVLGISENMMMLMIFNCQTIPCIHIQPLIILSME